MHVSPPSPYLHALDEQFHFLRPNDEHHNSRRRPKAEKLRGTPVRIDPVARRVAVLRALDTEFGRTLREVCQATGLRPGAVRRTIRRLTQDNQVISWRTGEFWGAKKRLYANRPATQGVA